MSNWSLMTTKKCGRFSDYSLFNILFLFSHLCSTNFKKEFRIDVQCARCTYICIGCWIHIGSYGHVTLLMIDVCNDIAILPNSICLTLKSKITCIQGIANIGTQVEVTIPVILYSSFINFLQYHFLIAALKSFFTTPSTSSNRLKMLQPRRSPIQPPTSAMKLLTS